MLVMRTNIKGRYLTHQRRRLKVGRKPIPVEDTLDLWAAGFSTKAIVAWFKSTVGRAYQTGSIKTIIHAARKRNDPRAIKRGHRGGEETRQLTQPLPHQDVKSGREPL